MRWTICLPDASWNMKTDQALSALQQACDAGWIRPLDLAFARFLAQLQPQAEGLLLLAAALVSRQLGHGHICLPLSGLSNPDRGDPQFAWLPSQTPEQWRKVLQASPLLGDGPGNTPLVFSRGRLYLRRYWQYEIDVAAGIADRLQQSFPLAEDLPQRLAALFPGDQGPDWQKIACALALRKAFAVITGGPGTGKTTTVLKLLAVLQQQAGEQGRNWRILLAAPTGKAAARLSESIGGALSRLPVALQQAIPQQVHTLHKLLGARGDSRQLTHHRHNPLHADLLVVDEASMVDLEMMAALLQALPRETRLILLGDKDQLASVEAGSVLGDLCANAGRYDPETARWLQQVCGGSLAADTQASMLDNQIALLRESHRFSADSGIGQLATAVNRGDGDGVLAIWQRQSPQDIRRWLDFSAFDRLAVDGWQDGIALGYRHYLQVLQQQRPTQFDPASVNVWADAVLKAFDRFQVLCALRQGEFGVEQINRRIAELLRRESLIDPAQAWYEGRPVMVNRNDYALGLMNGDIGIALRIPESGGGERLRVAFRLASNGIKQVLPSRLTDVEDVYAMTVHKSQGSEFEHVTLMLPDSGCALLTRELLYTGITRAKSRFSLLCASDKTLLEAVATRVARAGGLQELLE